MANEAPGGLGSDGFLLAIVAGSIGLILVGVVAVFLVGRSRTTTTFDPNGPAGVVQAYVEAIRAGDRDRAYDLLSRSARDDLSRATYRDRFPAYIESNDRSARLVIEPISERADEAEVKVTISRFSARSDPFSASTYHSDVTVRLVREDGAWRISQPAGPYPFVN